MARTNPIKAPSPDHVAANGRRAPVPAPPVLVPCPHPAARRVPLFPAHDYITGDRFEIARCAACGLTVTEPPPGPAALGAYYPAGYYGSAGGRRFPGPVEWLQNQLYAYRARQLEQMNGGRPGRVLDVGCGRGLLLRQLHKRGWEVMGTELTEESAAYPRNVLGLPVQTGELAALEFPADHFDAVVLWHVLEHVPDPRIVLAEVARILRPGGVFLVAVPNFGSLEARLTRDKWFHLDVPRHLGHFTPAVLYKDLRQAGLRARRATYFAPEYDFFSFAQSALNRLGVRHNLLYNILRGRSAKVMHAEGVSNGQVLATFALAPLLGALSVPGSLLAAALRQGATITVYATKK